MQHAYRVRAQLLHPDRHRGASKDVVQEAEREMTRLNEAWGVIRDEGQRRVYDRQFEPVGQEPKSTPRRERPSGSTTSTRTTTPPPPRTAPLQKVAVTCPDCRTETLADTGALRVTCANCGRACRFAICPKCKTNLTCSEHWSQI